MSEFGLTCRHLLAAMLVLAGLTAVRSEDAVERNGTKHVGRLQNSKDGWFFQSEQGKPIPLTELAYIRFESKGTPLPKAPLTHTLVLPGQQRCAGTLVTVDEKKVVFITSWGKTITLKRDQVAGIEQEALVALDRSVSRVQSLPRHDRGRQRASEPIGSHGGRTMGGNLSAFCRGLGNVLLRAAISNTYSSNHESFMTKNPLRPHFSSPQLFSTRQRRGRLLTTSTPVNSIAWVKAVWW